MEYQPNVSDGWSNPMSKQLNNSQKAKARRTLAEKKGVSESQISDYDISAAFTAGTLTNSDCGVVSDSGGFSGGGDSGGGACD